jgi:hypothetical protein
MIFHRNWLRWVPITMILGTLVGCTVTFTFDPVIRDTVNAVASTDPSPVLMGESLAGGESAYYRVDIAQTRDLLYVEADGSDLQVSLLSSSGALRGVARSTAYFASTLSTLEAMEAAATAPSAIEVDFACIGPCVATRASASTYYVRVDNLSGSGRTFDLYAYTMDENDTFEPNDTSAAAVSLSQAGSVTAAIETLGDVDWYRYTGQDDRELLFDAGNDALGLVLEIENGPRIQPGDSETIFAGERFFVRSTRGRAGAPDVSTYAVTIGDVVSGPVVDGVLQAEDTTVPSVQVDSLVIPGSGTRLYEVQVPIARDLLYVEADGANVRVTLQTNDRNRTTLAVSESPTYFASSIGDLSTAALRPSSIDVEFTCFGPCAAIEPVGGGSYIMEVRNLSGSSTTVDVYAYTFDENDTLEPNDTAGSAYEFSSGPQTLSGAIERIGDEDWFAYTGDSRDFTFFDVSGGDVLDLVLEIVDGPTVTPGGTNTFLDGDVFVVRSASGRAGPSGTSSYAIEVD